MTNELKELNEQQLDAARAAAFSDAFVQETKYDARRRKQLERSKLKAATGYAKGASNTAKSSGEFAPTRQCGGPAPPGAESAMRKRV